MVELTRRYRFILFFAVFATSQAQFRPAWVQPGGNVSRSEQLPHMTGRLSQDFPEVEKKSPMQAAVLSAAIPGLGQAYGEDWSLSWRSLAFFGAEVVMWTGYAINSSKADRLTADFEAYADEHWDVTEYVRWIEQNIGQLNSSANCGNIITSTDPSIPPWNRVDWGELNRCEEEIGSVTGTGFTHRLPRRPEQQYYELIGKYPQYGGGWDDAAGFTPGDILTDNVSERFLEYRTMRGRANELYNMATTFSYVLVANHVFSALEAAWGAAMENRRIRAESEVRRIDIGTKRDFVAVVSVKIGIR